MNVYRERIKRSELFSTNINEHPISRPTLSLVASLLSPWIFQEISRLLLLLFKRKAVDYLAVVMTLRWPVTISHLLHVLGVAAVASRPTWQDENTLITFRQRAQQSEAAFKKQEINVFSSLQASRQKNLHALLKMRWTKCAKPKMKIGKFILSRNTSCCHLVGTPALYSTSPGLQTSRFAELLFGRDGTLL